MWVGKSAYFTADPMTIEEGKRDRLLKPYQIVELRQGVQDVPGVNLLAQQPFWFDTLRSPPPKDLSGDCSSNHPPSPRVSPLEAKNITDIRETRGLNHLSSLQLPQIMGLRAIGVSLLTTFSMSSRSDQSDGSRHSRQGRCNIEKKGPA